MSTYVGAAGPKFAACMRSHGVPKYPDPDKNGVITISASLGFDPDSPLFQKAYGVCGKLLPPGKTLSVAQQHRLQTRLLAFAACMRTHGVPAYPDPRFTNGGVTQGFDAKAGLDPNSPIFQRAQKTCRKN